MNQPTGGAGEPVWRVLPDKESRAEAWFKWGWNAETGEAAIWEVNDRDGLPAHGDHLSGVWGRRPSLETGDTLGNATWEPPRVFISSFYGGPVPEAVVVWFRSAYPEAEVITSS